MSNLKLKRAKEGKEEVKFNETLSFAIDIDEGINNEKRTVKVCALAPCVSRNNRYYSPKIVEKAAKHMQNKRIRSFSGHDDRNPKNIVGYIKESGVKNGRAYATIKFSNAKDVAESIFTRIKEGIITDVSIAASGSTKKVKMGESYVDAVQEKGFELRSVDFVSEGGVSDAKVLKVFEEKEIPTIEEVKESEEKVIETVEQLREEYPDFVTEIEKPLKDEIVTLKTEKEALEKEKLQKELDTYKEEKIKALDVDDKVKDILRSRVSGESKEDIDKSIQSEQDFITQVIDATKKETKVEGIPEVKKKEEKEQPWTKARIMEDARIPEEHKVGACEVLILSGSEKMIGYLKGRGVKL